jgi:hypothetical protein
MCNFKVTFNFEYDAPLVDTTLQIIKFNIFTSKELIELVPLCSVHRYFETIHEILECYNVVEEDQEDKHSRNLQIP